MNDRCLLRTLKERWGLTVATKVRRSLENMRVWNPEPGIHQLDLDDVVTFARECSNQQRNRNGSMAMALRGLRNKRFPTDHMAEEWFSKTFGCRLHPVGEDWVPVVGTIYIIFERITTLNRWTNRSQDRDSEVLRMRLIDPVHISPRANRIHGDEVIIEQPMVERFLQREGWRCWMHKCYRSDLPKSKIGIIDVDSGNPVVYRVEGFHDGHERPFPFLINWCADSSEIGERIRASFHRTDHNDNGS